MINNTDNKIIQMNMKSALENDSSIVFDAMQELANESIDVENCNSELQIGYMKLLSNQIKSKQNMK